MYRSASIVRKFFRKEFFSLGIIFSFFTGCTNPFAPKLVVTPGFGLGDQTTIEGVFQNFRYAYTYKDTLIYGQLLAPDFTFSYRNYDEGVDVTITRQEDMFRTAKLFSVAQKIDLVWTDPMIVTGDSAIKDISRGFNIAFTFAANDIARIDGRVNMRMLRDSVTKVWRIQRWRDESNY